MKESRGTSEGGAILNRALFFMILLFATSLAMNVPLPGRAGGPLFSGFDELGKAEEIALVVLPIPSLFVGILAACLTVFIDKSRIGGASSLIYRRYSLLLAPVIGFAIGLLLGLYMGTHGSSNEC